MLNGSALLVNGAEPLFAEARHLEVCTCLMPKRREPGRMSCLATSEIVTCKGALEEASSCACRIFGTLMQRIYRRRILVCLILVIYAAEPSEKSLHALLGGIASAYPPLFADDDP